MTMKNSNLAIEVENLGKMYKLYSKPSDSVKELITGRPRHQERWALKDISFTVGRGEVVGVIGSNGAGKSTLLKILAGTLDKTEGSVRVDGRISAILELGTGFHPLYTGRENIVMGGMCLGMSRDEIENKQQWIIDFSELGEVIDHPFHTYSSGMQARLTFATAVSVEPEILIIDEALAAGDAYFVSKCLRQIRDICESGSTVLFVSHSTYLVIELCQQAIWIDKGHIMGIGNSYEIAKRYEKATSEEIDRRHMTTAKRASEKLGKSLAVDGSAVDTVAQMAADTNGDQTLLPLDINSPSPTAPSQVSGDTVPENPESPGPREPTHTIARAPIRFTGISMHANDGAERYVFGQAEDIRIRVAWEGESNAEKICAGLRIDGPRIQAVAGYDSGEDKAFLRAGAELSGRGTFEFWIKSPNLGMGTYFISASLFQFDIIAGDHNILFAVDRIASFEINRQGDIPYTYVCELDTELVEFGLGANNTYGSNGQQPEQRSITSD